MTRHLQAMLSAFYCLFQRHGKDNDSAIIGNQVFDQMASNAAEHVKVLPVPRLNECNAPSAAPSSSPVHLAVKHGEKPGSLLRLQCVVVQAEIAADPWYGCAHRRLHLRGASALY